MIIAPLADVKAKLSAYLEKSATNGPIIITRNGKAVAVLLTPADDEDLESLVLSRSPRFQALLNKSRQSIKAGKSLGVMTSGRLSQNTRPQKRKLFGLKENDGAGHGIVS
jgi:prevent-host-death family protein